MWSRKNFFDLALLRTVPGFMPLLSSVLPDLIHTMMLLASGASNAVFLSCFLAHFGLTTPSKNHTARCLAGARLPFRRMGRHRAVSLVLEQAIPGARSPAPVSSRNGDRRRARVHCSW